VSMQPLAGCMVCSCHYHVSHVSPVLLPTCPAVNFFSPMARYSYAIGSGADGSALQQEFKLLVREAHKRGIEVRDRAEHCSVVIDQSPTPATASNGGVLRFAVVPPAFQLGVSITGQLMPHIDVHRNAQHTLRTAGHCGEQ